MWRWAHAGAARIKRTLNAAGQKSATTVTETVTQQKNYDTSCCPSHPNMTKAGAPFRFRRTFMRGWSALTSFGAEETYLVQIMDPGIGCGGKLVARHCRQFLGPFVMHCLRLSISGLFQAS